MIESRCSVLRCPPWIFIRGSRGVLPIRRRAASSGLPSVAEIPQARRFGFSCRSRARTSSVCTPRFDPISSCHSSTTTQRVVASWGRTSAWVSSSERLSGVVMSASGSCRSCLFFKCWGLSEVRRSRRQPTPSPSIASRKFASVSVASARMGVIHSRRQPGAVGWGSAIPSTRGPIHAASVFPVPVAASIIPWQPLRYAFHASLWNRKGDHPRKCIHWSTRSSNSPNGARRFMSPPPRKVDR